MNTTFQITKSFKLLTFICAAIIVTQSLKAQDEFERVEVLDNPRYSLNHRFVVDGDLTYYPVDAFYKPITGDIAVSYQFHDFFSWEVVRFGYSLTNYDTKLNNTIAAVATNYADEQVKKVDSTKDAEPLEGTTSEELKKFKFRVGSTAFFNLLYSKSNFFNLKTVYHYWQAGLGASYFDLGKTSQGESKNQISLDLVLRARFFLNQHFMTNIRGGYSFGLKKDVPQQMVFLTGGVGYVF